MSEVTDLVVIEKANAITVFQSADQIEEILGQTHFLVVQQALLESQFVQPAHLA